MPDYTQLTTTQAKSASKALMKEAVQLSPSAVISMFEIDLSDILEDDDPSNNIIKLKPHDTVYIEQTRFSYYVENTRFLNTILQFINLYFNVTE